MGGLLIFFSVFGSDVSLGVGPTSGWWLRCSSMSPSPAWGFATISQGDRPEQPRHFVREKILWQTIITVIALAAILWNRSVRRRFASSGCRFTRSRRGFSRADWVCRIVGADLLLDRGLQQRDQPHRRSRRPGDRLHDHRGVGVRHHGVRGGEGGYVALSPDQLCAGTGELAVICGAMVGAGMAFLWYNSYPAEVFMGTRVRSRSAVCWGSWPSWCSSR